MTTTPEPVGMYLVPTVVINRFLVACRLLAGLLAIGALSMGFRIAQVTDFPTAKFTALSGVPGWPEVWGAALCSFGFLVLVGRMIDHKIADVVTAGASVACAIWYCIFAASIYLGGGQYAYTIYGAVAGLHFVMAWLLYRSAGLRPKHVEGVVIR